MKKINLLILISLFFSSCGKEKINEVIDYSALGEGNNFTNTVVTADGKVMRQRILNNDDPCFEYVGNANVEIVSSCEEIIEGRGLDVYKYFVSEVKFCVLEQPNIAKDYKAFVGKLKFEDQNSKSEIIEFDFGSFLSKTDFDDIQVYEPDREDYRTEIFYHTKSDVMVWKDKSKLFRKRQRFFRVQCRPYLF